MSKNIKKKIKCYPHPNRIKTGRNTKGHNVYICKDCGHVFTGIFGIIGKEYKSLKEYMEIKNEEKKRMICRLGVKDAKP